jgi:hypothetical protein
MALYKVWKEVFMVIVLILGLWEHKIIRHDNNAHALELLRYAFSPFVILIVTLNEYPEFLVSKPPYL